MCELYDEKIIQIKKNKEKIVKLVNEAQIKLVNKIRNERQKLTEEYLMTTLLLDNHTKALKDIQNQLLHIEDYKKEIEWNRSFMNLLTIIKRELDCTNQLNTEEAIEQLRVDLINIQILAQSITKWKAIEEEITSTPFFFLELNKKQAELNELHKELTHLHFNKEQIIKKIKDEIQSFNELLEKTKCLQQIALLPNKDKLLTSFNILNNDFTIRNIDLMLLSTNKGIIEDSIKKNKEEVKVALKLQAIRKEIDNLKFEVHYSSDYYLIECELIVELLENDMIKVKAIKGKKISEERRNEAKELYKLIEDVQTKIEKLMLAQNRFMQARKLFEYSLLKNTALYTKYKEHEEIFINLVRELKDLTNVKKFAETSSYQEKLKLLNEGLEKNAKELEELLETKRMQAPRLLFLSNVQLLEFFKDIKDKTFEHISLLFTGIKKLLIEQTLPPDLSTSNSKPISVIRVLKEEQKKLSVIEKPVKSSQCQIIGFTGTYEELVKINKPIVLTDKEDINVEWLIELEAQMQKTVSKEISSAINTFTQTDLEEWIFDYHMQAVLTATHIIITHEIVELLQPELDIDLEQSIETEMASTRNLNQPQIVGNEVNRNAKDQKELEEIFGHFVNDQGFPKLKTAQEIVKLTKENSIAGIKLRIMLWLILLSKFRVKGMSYPLNELRIRTLEEEIILLNYMKDVVDDLEVQKVTKQSDYNWKKHIRISWSSEERTSKVDIGSFSLQQKNEYLPNTRYCLLYPLAERVFVNITSSLREKSGIVIKSHGCLDQGTEIFKEFSSICSTPLFCFRCYSNSTLKHALQILNAAALAGVWLLFENLEKFNLQILNTLSKEIQMVQQQFIIADLVSSDQEEERSENMVDDAMIEHSSNSLQLKKKKHNTSHDINPKPPSINNKTIFGVFATAQCEVLDTLGGDIILEGLKGAFRITGITFTDIGVYVEILLRGKQFTNPKEIVSKLFGFYLKVEKYKGYQRPGFRAIKTIIELAETIRNHYTIIPKDKSSRIATTSLYDFDVAETIKVPELEVIGQAIYLYEKGYIPKKLTGSDWSSIIISTLSELSINIKEFSSIPYKAKQKTKTELYALIKEVLGGLKLIQVPLMMDKMYNLYQASLTRSHICVIGPSLSGKSTLLTSFCSFLYRLQGQLVKKFILNPKAEPKDFLYAGWRKDICLLKVIESEIKHHPNDAYCILCDSDIDQMWLDVFMGGLATFPEFHLSIPKSTLFLYECTELSNLSPRAATLMTIEYIGPDSIPHKDMVLSSAVSLYEEVIKLSGIIDKKSFVLLISNIYKTFITFLKRRTNDLK